MIDWIKNNWFELITAAVAVIALVQPWIVKLIQAKKAKLEILPNRTIDIGFNKRGIYVIAYVAVVSKSIESVLSSIKIKILKDNNCVYNLESDMFLNPYSQWYSAGGQSIDFSSATYAYQIFLSKGKPELFKIQFVDYSVEEKVKQYIAENSRDNLLIQCKFEKGEYELVFELTDANSKTYSSSHIIEFKDNEVKYLQDSVDRVLKNETHNQINLPLKKKT